MSTLWVQKGDEHRNVQMAEHSGLPTEKPPLCSPMPNTIIALSEDSVCFKRVLAFFKSQTPERISYNLTNQPALSSPCTLAP